MRKYGGTLIHRAQDEWGPIEVVQDLAERSLHFGTEPKQSSMALSDPIRLVLSYTRAMLAPLLFLHEPPRSALLVGLGGGSIAKFLLHAYPRCQLDVVELRPSVVEIAREFFRLPDEPRLRVTIADGAEFILSAPDAYDLVIIDAFDHRGIAQSTCGPRFYSALRGCMQPTGLLAANLWVRDALDVEELMDDLTLGLGTRVARLPVAGRDNLIALAGLPTLGRRSARPLLERAQALETAHDVEFPLFLRTLRKHNVDLL